jgi:hypothetical protein
LLGVGRFKDAVEQLPYKAIYMHSGDITERRWKRFAQNFLSVKDVEQVAILKQTRSYLYLTHNKLYHYATDDNGAPHLLEREGGAAASLSGTSSAVAQILSPRGRLSATKDSLLSL